MEGIFWLAVILIMSVIEIITLGLTTIWFAGGAVRSRFGSPVGSYQAAGREVF